MKALLNEVREIILSNECSAVIADKLNNLGLSFLVQGHDYVLNGNLIEIDSYTGEESMSRFDVSLIYCDQEPNRPFCYRQDIAESDINELKWLAERDRLQVFINDNWETL